jgi:type IV pilus assembly protein PilW
MLSRLSARALWRRQGFSLIELMIGITLGMIVIAGVTAVFISSNQTRNEIERSNRQIENGRYASAILAEDLRMAGFLSSFDPYQNIIKPLNPPLSGASVLTAIPNPCETSVTGATSSLMNTFFIHVQGVDGVTSSTTPSCLSDVKAGTDILVIRRLSSCVAGPTAGAGCGAVIAGVPYFQASNCNAAGELATKTGSNTDYLSYFVLSKNSSAFVKRNLDCLTTADYRRLFVRIYFVSNNNVGTDGVPTLKRAELGPSGFTTVSLVDGIENIQFEYGMDTGADGLVDVFNSNPSSYGGCAGTACLLNWLRAYSAKVYVLARSTTTTTGHVDSKTYALGKKADGVTENSFGPYSDAYKRIAFTSTVRLENPAGRRLP